MIDATAVSVVWNEGPRIRLLAQTIAAHFAAGVIVVQKSDDNTLIAAREGFSTTLAVERFVVIEDEWRGGGDFSMPLALSHVKTEWSFVISGDELPDMRLLDTMNDAIVACEAGNYSGAMIKCEETIEGVRYVEHPAHVRLFRTAGGWEARHHSAASHDNLLPYIWPHGAFIHTRSLEEVCRDYLRKLTMMEAEGEERLALHNRYTIFNVCNLVAGEKGWRFVWNLEQWPEIERRVFSAAQTSMEVI